MQYTIRKIPKALNAALRRRAKQEKKTLNQVAVEAMSDGLGLVPEGGARRSLRDIAGALSRDPELDAALEAQRQIDLDMWR